jgi:hypothetical protein
MHSNNPAAVTQNAGFSSHTANQLGMNLTPGVNGAFGRGANQLGGMNAIGPNAPSSVQFGFQGSTASPSVGHHMAQFNSHQYQTQYDASKYMMQQHAQSLQTQTSSLHPQNRGASNKQDQLPGGGFGF